MSSSVRAAIGWRARAFHWIPLSTLFWQGQTAESIAQAFPVLSLEQVYGAIAFYLANRSEIDIYLAKAEVSFEALRQAARDADPAFYQKLAAVRPQEPAARP